MKISNIGWSIGNYCNANCNHCYSKKQRNVNDILTRDEIDLIISKIVHYGVKTVNFGGNEPIFTDGSDLSKTQLPYIIDTLHSSNVSIGITTNGYTFKVLHDLYFKSFMKVNDWDFSLDSPDCTLHNKNRNCDTLFDLVIDGINKCNEYNLTNSIVVAGMKSNFNLDTLEKFLEITKKYKSDLRINLLKPLEKSHFDLMPSINEVYTGISYLLNNTDIKCLTESVFSCQVGINSTCPCGTNSFRIRGKSDGRVPITPCVYLPIDSGDLLTQEIDEILSNEEYKKFVNRKILLPNECKKLECEFIETCRGGCSARALLVNNDYNAVDPYCPKLNNIYLKNMIDKDCSIEEDGILRVHENYLCTFIGSNND